MYKVISKIKSTKAFQNASIETQNMILSPSVIGLFENAIAFKEAGMTYNDWLCQTCAGVTATQVVKEIFSAS